MEVKDLEGKVMGYKNSGIQVINTVQLIAAAIPGYWNDIKNFTKYSYKETGDMMQAYVEKFVEKDKIHWFSVPKEMYYEHIAIQEAIETDCTVVITENLS